MKVDDEMSRSEVRAGLQYTIYSESRTLKGEVRLDSRVIISTQLARCARKLVVMEQAVGDHIKAQEAQILIGSINELRDLVYLEVEKLWKKRGEDDRVEIAVRLANWTAELAKMEEGELEKNRVRSNQSG